MKASSFRPRALIKRARRELAERAPTGRQQRHGLVGPAHLWKEKRDFQIAFLRGHGLEPSSTLLDVGCGTLRGGVPLIDYLDVGNYTGVDVRADIAAEAAAELADEGLTGKRPELVFGVRLADVHLDRRFSVAWAYSVLIHLTDDLLDECLAFTREHLEPGGVFYANVNLGEHKPDRWLEFPVLWRTLDAYEQHAARAGFTVENLGPLHKLGLKGDEGAAQKMLRFVPS